MLKTNLFNPNILFDIFHLRHVVKILMQFPNLFKIYHAKTFCFCVSAIFLLNRTIVQDKFHLKQWKRTKTISLSIVRE